MSLPPRLVAKFTRSASGCWEWTASRNRLGYGRVWWDGRVQGAHRVVYGLMVGQILDGMELDHLCRVRHCVNPDHLEQVTRAENNRRAGLAVTSCPRGHPYDQQNTYQYPDGRRECRTCHARRGRERKRAMNGAAA